MRICTGYKRHVQLFWLSCSSNRWQLNNSNWAAACLQRCIRVTWGRTLFIFAGLALKKAAESPGLHSPASPRWELWAHLVWWQSSGVRDTNSCLCPCMGKQVWALCQGTLQVSTRQGRGGRLTGNSSVDTLCWLKHLQMLIMDLPVVLCWHPDHYGQIWSIMADFSVLFC